MKILIILLAVIGCFFVFDYTDSNKVVIPEDIDSYNIKTRYDCHQIQDNTKYNDCIKHYLEATPYQPGDIIVPMRRTK